MVYLIYAAKEQVEFLAIRLTVDSLLIQTLPLIVLQHYLFPLLNSLKAMNFLRNMRHRLALFITRSKQKLGRESRSQHPSTTGGLSRSDATPPRSLLTDQITSQSRLTPREH